MKFKVTLIGGEHDGREIWLKECPERIRILNCPSPGCDGIAFCDELIVYGVETYRRVSDEHYAYEGSEQLFKF